MKRREQRSAALAPFVFNRAAVVRKEGGCGWAREDGGRGGEGAGDLRRTFANGADEDGGTEGGTEGRTEAAKSG